MLGVAASLLAVGVKTDVTTPSNVGTCSASWEGYGKGKRKNEFVEWHVAWVAK